MKLRALVLFAVSALLVCSVSSLSAQDSTETSRGPDGGTRVHVTGIQVLPVTGKPFSGRDSIEWTRTLEDGSVVTTRLTALVARDSQGRIRRERANFVPADSNQQSKPMDMIILDPVEHTRTTCNIASRRCTVTDYSTPVKFSPDPAGPLDHGKRFLERESLGTGIVDDLNVMGTRETLTINAGVIGNSEPVVTTREFWYSSDLEINLSVTREDPREGTQRIQLIDLSRSEPDPALFRVPSDFVSEDQRTAAKTGN
jgi:hypothetical protein